MDKRITFRGTPHSQAIENYANEQLAKIELFLENESSPIYINLMLEPSKVHAHHKVTLLVKSPRYDLVSDYEGPDFYLVLNRVIDVMYDQLCQAKRKIVDSRKKMSKTEDFENNE